MYLAAYPYSGVWCYNLHKLTPPYIRDTFQRINLFYITFAEALHFGSENEEH